MSLVAIAMATSIVLAADAPPLEGNPTVPSGPVAGAELPVISAKRVRNGSCIHCAMT